MKTIQYIAFGNTDVIRMEEVEKPTPKPNEVLIRVKAVSVNRVDSTIRQGEMGNADINFPYVPGTDLAGIVEETGSLVTRLKVGDKVFGMRNGTYAELVAINADQVAIMPSNTVFTQAAALAAPLVYAHTFLSDEGKLKANQKVLIHGASGGTGHIVLQFAKAVGAYVVATATGAGLAFVKQLGADIVIDHQLSGFIDDVCDIDLVIDLIGGTVLQKIAGVIKPGGKLLSTAAFPGNHLAEMYGITVKYLKPQPSCKKLEFGKMLVELGMVKPYVVNTMNWGNVAVAQDIVKKRSLNGKIVLTID